LVAQLQRDEHRSDREFVRPKSRINCSAAEVGGLAMSEVACWKRSACYLSTPEHVRSFIGRFIYLYTDKGELCLTETALRFVGKSGLPVEISLDSITDVSVGHYSRWAKPFRLDHIAVRHRNGGTERTTLLTPTRSWATPTWETNKIVAEWVDALKTNWSRQAEPGDAADGGI